MLSIHPAPLDIHLSTPHYNNTFPIPYTSLHYDAIKVLGYTRITKTTLKRLANDREKRVALDISKDFAVISIVNLEILLCVPESDGSN